MKLPGVTLIFACVVPSLAAQAAPSDSVRRASLRAVVYVEARDCPSYRERSGTGFVLDAPGNIVTAHHVVGGCKTIKVHYNGVPASQTSIYDAALVRVFPIGDLALLKASNSPVVPALKLASPPFDRNVEYSGLGYQNGQLTPGDVKVGFSSGDDKLSQVLTTQLIAELDDLKSPIDKSRRILRFNDALQPGMSGGPIIDGNGDVIGVVAGGLKAGAAPASWGWPSNWINSLLTSTAPVSMPILTSRVYYSSTELQELANTANQGRTIRCGDMTLLFLGTQRFSQLAMGADDAPRLSHLSQLSRMSSDQLNNLRFDVWRHTSSGATAVLPAGYQLQRSGNHCKAMGKDGQFAQLLWGANATSPMEIQIKSLRFEEVVIVPMLPQLQFWSFDPQLTTTVVNNNQVFPGPQFRANGLVFTRKGLMYPKLPQQGPSSPILHVFETLIAKSGTFLGVATINNEVNPALTPCLTTNFAGNGCESVRDDLDTWTHFVLATQLSTYPIN